MGVRVSHRKLTAEKLTGTCLPPTVCRYMVRSFLRAVCDVARLLGNIIIKVFTMATMEALYVDRKGQESLEQRSSTIFSKDEGLFSTT